MFFLCNGRPWVILCNGRSRVFGDFKSFLPMTLCNGRFYVMGALDRSGISDPADFNKSSCICKVNARECRNHTKKNLRDRKCWLFRPSLRWSWYFLDHHCYANAHLVAVWGATVQRRAVHPAVTHPVTLCNGPPCVQEFFTDDFM